jgi:hypothetical protein
MHSGHTTTNNLIVLECYRHRLASSRSSDTQPATTQTTESNLTDIVATTENAFSDAVLRTLLYLSTDDRNYCKSSDAYADAVAITAIAADCQHCCS